MNQVYEFADFFNLTGTIVAHGEESIKVPRLDLDGHKTPFTDEVKIGTIKFDNGSRIIAFSAHPQAMAVYGGDVGLDEFAKHPNAKLLWETAQARITWGFDIAVWSSHDGEDTEFNQFAQQARAACSADFRSADFQSAVSQTSSLPTSTCNGASNTSSLASLAEIKNQKSKIKNPAVLPSPRGEGQAEGKQDVPQQPVARIENQNSKIQNSHTPWNLYYRVTMPDAIELRLLDVINRTQGTHFTAEQFLADCRARAGSEEVFQQSYMCNPLGASAASIVEWSAIERCRSDYSIERVHLESPQLLQQFGQFNPAAQSARESQIHDFLRAKFPVLLGGDSPIENQKSKIKNVRLGFDVAASGQGNLAALYIDEAKGDQLWLRALLTARTEDWHFLKEVLFYFLRSLRNLQGAGDESGLGRQICWEAANHFSSRFLKVNFASKKHDLGFALMNQLTMAEKHFPRNEADIAQDFFALRKIHTGTKWVFTEGRNSLNPDSHCDIAWAAALASHAHTNKRVQAGGIVVYDTEEEQNAAPNRGYFGCEPPPLPPAPVVNPNQEYTLACAFCTHRPKSFNPVPKRCEKCRSYLPSPA